MSKLARVVLMVAVLMVLGVARALASGVVTFRLRVELI
jgi:hypothetical protein